MHTGKFEEFDPLAKMPGGRAGHSFYDVRADSQNNVYLTEYQKNNLARIDAKTGQFTFYQVPTGFSRNRRGRIDDQDRFWFAQYRGNKITMFDTRKETFQEWPLPTKFTNPYDVVTDKNGDAWTGGMASDRVVRLDPKTGKRGRISAAARHQHAAHVRRQLDHAADLLGRQQPRRLDREGRAAGLRRRQITRRQASPRRRGPIRRARCVAARRSKTC